MQATRRDTTIVGLGLAGVALLAWADLLHMSRAMAETASMAAMGMGPAEHSWDSAELLMTFLMWAVMMVAMMVPSATPMILAFATVNRNRAARGGPFVATTIFLAGYVAVWTAFSLLASAAQWSLHSVALLNPETMTVAPWIGGGLLIAAGVFQLSPLKNRCLARCRSPFDFLTFEWREGSRGALTMGVRHGAFCTGCCWLLMLLLFVAGVMNLLWVAAIAAFVLVEKLLPRGRWLSYAGAVGCVAAGVLWLFGRFHLG